MSRTTKLVDLYFLGPGNIAHMSFDNGAAQRWGIEYHLFASMAEAQHYAQQYPHRPAVIQERVWGNEFIDGPHVRDHRVSA